MSHTPKPGVNTSICGDTRMHRCCGKSLIGVVKAVDVEPARPPRTSPPFSGWSMKVACIRSGRGVHPRQYATVALLRVVERSW